MNEPEPIARTPGDAGQNHSERSLLLRGGVARVLAYSGMVLLSVLWTVVLARRLGVARFGVYTSAMSVTSVATTLVDAGMGNYATREYASRHGTERARIMGDIFGLRVTTATFGVLLAAGFAVAAGYQLPILIGVVLATAGIVPLISAQTMWLPLINDLRLTVVSSLELLRQAIWGSLLIGLALAGFGLLPLMASLLVTNLILVVVTLRIARNLDHPRLAIRPRAWPSLIHGAAAFSLATAVGTVYAYTTQIVTSLVSNPEQTGLFSVSFRIFMATAAIPALVASSALPVLSRAAQDDRERVSYVTKRLLEVSVAAGVGIALTMVAGARYFILLLGGRAFQHATGVLEVQALAVIASFTLMPCSFSLLAQGKYRGMLWANGLGLAVTLSSTVALAGAFGAVGAAIATICGETTVATFMVGSLLRAHPDSRPSTSVVLRLLLATACATPVMFLTFIPSLVRAVAFGGLYLVLVLALRILPPEIRHTLSAIPTSVTQRLRHQ
nr:oligosaccharide flippase family protein [Conexibacter sp. S30A1]